MICRKGSGSSFSARAVEPTRSMNKMATFFLASRGGALIGVPHIGQNRALSPIGAWQTEHVISRRPTGSPEQASRVAVAQSPHITVRHSPTAREVPALPTLSHYFAIDSRRLAVQLQISAVAERLSVHIGGHRELRSRIRSQGQPPGAHTHFRS